MHETLLPHDHGQKIEKLTAALPSSDDFKAASELFRLLADTTRIKIFWLLCHCEECVINISALMDMTSPAVSHHLNKLKTAGLITSRRDGKEVYYKAATSTQSNILHDMVEQLVVLNCPDI